MKIEKALEQIKRDSELFLKLSDNKPETNKTEIFRLREKAREIIQSVNDYLMVQE